MNIYIKNIRSNTMITLLILCFVLSLVNFKYHNQTNLSIGLYFWVSLLQLYLKIYSINNIINILNETYELTKIYDDWIIQF